MALLAVFFAMLVFPPTRALLRSVWRVLACAILGLGFLILAAPFSIRGDRTRVCALVGGAVGSFLLGLCLLASGAGCALAASLGTLLGCSGAALSYWLSRKLT